MGRVVIVCDNAPAHIDLELVPDENEFHGVTILREAPYSVIKTAIKKQMADTFAELMELPPAATTQTEYRLKYLEAPTLSLRNCNYV